jgi:hypothetical protein
MTDAELFKHYKAIAPMEDLKFWLANARMSDALRAGFQALKDAADVTSIPRPEFYRQFVRLQALWRVESNQRETVYRKRGYLLERLAVCRSINLTSSNPWRTIEVAA